MTVLHVFWLPILLSAVVVFVASSVIHMFLPWHKSDYGKVPEEDRLMDAARSLTIPPGDYMVPNCSSTQEMRSPEFKAKMQKGPVLIMTVIPGGPMQMGRSLGLWFLYVLVVSYFAAYVACHAQGAWVGYRQVFRFAGLTAFLGYAGALWQLSIWYRRSWLTTIRTTIDGVVYAALTAGVLGWLWPR